MMCPKIKVMCVIGFQYATSPWIALHMRTVLSEYLFQMFQALPSLLLPSFLNVFNLTCLPHSFEEWSGFKPLKATYSHTHKQQTEFYNTPLISLKM